MSDASTHSGRPAFPPKAGPSAGPSASPVVDFGELAMQVPVAILVFDASGACVWASPEWARENEGAGDPVGRSADDLLPAAGRSWAAMRDDVLSGSTLVSDGEASGSGSPTQWEARPWRNGGAISGMIVRTDIDVAGAQTFGALRRHDAHLQLALDAVQAGTWSWDRSRGDVSWDQTAERLADFRDALSVTSINDLLDHVAFDARNRVAKAFQLTAATGRRLAIEVPVETGSARRVLEVHAVATAVDEDGAIGMVGVCMDRTVEHDRLRMVREHDETLRMVIEAGRIGCYVRDLRAGTIRPDPVASSLLGGLPATVESLNALHANVIADDRGDLGMRIADALSGRNAYTVRYRVRDADGVIRHVRESGLVRNESSPGRLIGMLVDETEQQQTLDELRRTIEQLEHFTSVASHDLREPLRTISSYLSLIDERYGASLNESGRRYLGRAVDGAIRMQRLLQDMLAYARAGSQPIHPERVGLDDVIQEVIETFRPTLEASGGSIVAGGLPFLLVDRSQMVQIMQNLIGNALKFRGEERPEIVVRAEQSERGWLIDVVDNGIGVPEGERERIFEIFQRLKETRDQEGTGVGLAVCRRMIERHRGTIEVLAGASRGTTFRIMLPDRGVPTDGNDAASTAVGDRLPNG
ncbi:MAG: ATP-binding protein [Phycisphaerales bacterium]